MYEYVMLPLGSCVHIDEFPGLYCCLHSDFLVVQVYFTLSVYIVFLKCVFQILNFKSQTTCIWINFKCVIILMILTIIKHH